MNKFFLKNSLQATHITKPIGGREHVVVPAIALQEGVLNGIFYPAEQISALPEKWNGVPITVNHPDNQSGSANTVEQEDSRNIGKFLNVRYEDKKLKGDICIDVEKAKNLGFESVVKTLQNDQLMEVSTGLLCERESSSGKFGDKEYSEVITSIYPDHLALLPDCEGACSIEDGCGAMRLNKEEDCECKDEKSSSDKVVTNKINSFFKFIANKIGFKFNETSHEGIEDQLRGYLRTKYANEDSWYWIDGVYDTYFVYEQGGRYYRQSYSVSDQGVANVVDDQVEVSKRVEYDVVQNISDNKEVGVNKEEIVKQLIANKSVSFGEADKEVLMNLDQQVLEKMVPVQEVKAVQNEQAPVAPETQLGFKPDEIEQLRYILNQQKEVLGSKKEIVANSLGVKPEELDNTPHNVLDLMFNQIKPKANYGARGGSVIANEEKKENKPIFLATELMTDKNGEGK